MNTRAGWPICKRCNRPITMHHIRGLVAKCSDDKEAAVGVFTYQQVAEVRQSLNLSSSPEMRSKVAKAGDQYPLGAEPHKIQTDPDVRT